MDSEPGPSEPRNSKRTKSVFVLNTDWHDGLIGRKALMVPEHADMAEFASNEDAIPWGCDSKFLRAAKAKRIILRYPDKQEITVVVSRTLESCKWDNTPVYQRMYRDVKHKIWEAKAASNDDAGDDGEIDAEEEDSSAIEI